MTTSSEHHERSARPDPIALAVEALVYAPIGAAAYALEKGPDLVRTVVARGRAEVDVRQEQIAGRLKHAKGAGEVAIAFGLPVLRRKVEARIASLRPRETPPAPPRRAQAAPAPVVVPITADEPVRDAPVTEPNGHHAPAPAAEPEAQLAIPGYDALSASQVVEHLAGLSGDELAAVREYEASHRRRRTILGKIEQLTV
jgi:hypothetical protein